MNILSIISKVVRWFFVIVLLLLVSFFIIDIFFPIDLKKANDTSRVVTDKNNKKLFVTLNSTQKWRIKTNLHTIDPTYLKMLLGFEDKRFYEHHGVDVLALVRASWQLLKNGHITSGGSTITMQLARMIEPKSRTIYSKLVEIVRAIQLELHYTKEQILTAYLTLAPYGGNIEGIEAASWYYFAKRPSSLTPSQSALLTTMPKNPIAYNPIKHKKRAKKARNRVLLQANQNGILNKKLYNIALAEPLTAKTNKFPRTGYHLARKVMHNNNQSTVQTTIDTALQMQLQRWAKQTLFTLPKGTTMAAIIVENKTSRVRAYLGSANIFAKGVAGYIDMTQIIRSPGSSLKPFIYALGFEKKLIHQNTIILDEEIQIGNYHPHNFNGQYSAEVTVIKALQNSLNIPAVKILERIGAQNFIELLTKADANIFIPKRQATLPVALGGLGISLWDNVQLFTTLANGGTGKTLAIHKHQKQKEIKLLDFKTSQVITAILSDIPPPNNTIMQRGDIAFKTGTSYGYRDFWSIGYSKDYTVGVWIGNPKNTPVIKTSARVISAPKLFEIFGIIDNLYGIQTWNLNPKIMTQHPPKILKYFDKKMYVKNRLSFVYPKNNTIFQSAGCHKANVSLLLRNATPPLFCYIDGKPSNKVNPIKTILKFGTGAHNIKIIDKQNQQTNISFWVTAPDCQNR